MTGANSSRAERGVNLQDLVEEFYRDPIGHHQLGLFHQRKSVPAPYDDLLDHHAHMTVTVEAHAKEAVDVKVHSSHRSEKWYSREITLVTQASRRVVQYGIVRLDVEKLAPAVWTQIESQEIPLGRVLINHNVLREVELCGLWEVAAGPSLLEKMDQTAETTLFGRTALIHCDGEPAIELLEIVNRCEADHPL